ncbi:M23 family metallopeptidase [Acutalibacter caecimuris]|uniref:M23 family metallopeptidase n=1 Tax=Acutalibacter caecimuris TaxID=3093657 RepID=UPI00345F7201
MFVEHGDGWISAYAHLSALAVAPDETVTQGQIVGYIGSTGNFTGPHLHLDLCHNGDFGIGGQLQILFPLDIDLGTWFIL